MPPQITCASALPGKMGKHENHIFSLKKGRKTVVVVVWLPTFSVTLVPKIIVIELWRL